MDDYTEGFTVGFVVTAIVAIVVFATPFIGCRSSFEKEAMGNGCGKLVCNTDGACEFEWTCSE